MPKGKELFKLTINDTPVEANITQGDVFKNVKYYYRIEQNDADGTVEILELTFPYAIVITQACDLERCKDIVGSNNNGGKYLLSVMLLPIFNFEDVKKDGNYFEKEMFKEDEPLKRLTVSINHSGPKSGDSYRYFAFYNEKLFGMNVVDYTQYFGINYQTLLLSVSSRIGTLPFDESQKIINMFSAYFSRVSTSSSKVDENGNNIPFEESNNQ